MVQCRMGWAGVGWGGLYLWCSVGWGGLGWAVCMVQCRMGWAVCMVQCRMGWAGVGCTVCMVPRRSALSSHECPLKRSPDIKGHGCHGVGLEDNQYL